MADRDRGTKRRRLQLPPDYLHRVYAGVLGKLIGVYLGRPFEGWTHQRILKELGHIRYYVNDRILSPLVVTDDDVSGTFTFVRALEEHRPTLRGAEDVGRTWLNNVIKDRTVFWWGGNGVSTEHTAYLNLKKGIRAPKSGAIGVNGKTIAEQIGAQIFIDGFAMVVPGQPAAAAMLAGSAASVSHDGEALAAARMWAAMEAEAFLSRDVNHLLDTGMRYMGSFGLLRHAINDVRAWCEEDDDWLKTRQRIEDEYGYHKFPGFCHVIPNHSIMVMALIYAGTDFGEAMHIVNTCGWDTDCNSGNLGCLVAIMSGLAAFDNDDDVTVTGKVRGSGGLIDWRGPLADRALISSADGGYSINNAARIAYDITNMGRLFGGEDPLPPPKNGAQFHFTLPGSVQGFQPTTVTKERKKYKDEVTLEQRTDNIHNTTGLAINIPNLAVEAERVEVMTDTFAPPEVRVMEIYELVCSPLVYPGQTLKMYIKADAKNSAPAQVRLILRVYTYTDKLETYSSGPVILTPGLSKALSWDIPALLGCRPIQSVGISISYGKHPEHTVAGPFAGTIMIDHLGWTGVPNLILLPIGEKAGPRTFYKQSFVNGADTFALASGNFVVAQDEGEGLVSYGTREWDQYHVAFMDFVITGLNRTRNGVAFRVNGLRRYYALLFVKLSEEKKGVTLVKVVDEKTYILGGKDFEWEVDKPYSIVVNAKGKWLFARIEDTDVVFHRSDEQYPKGGIGIIASDGSVLVGSIEIGDPTNNSIPTIKKEDIDRELAL
ncbi:ADP-ribosylglycohydrolase [Annulohypoxylon truncatum]|uniref:ADP-ribosylglycohydrolase n=1 Tax=Annulohypoxylon truncatum TaxID=327061 RepID=UPI00200885DE|nr:ADP-ribosylglycohydrolase [Annulohypoxylon truncatum]KAI1204704.1 ADP-ribosylglycohydrolase [Annulohypoxylon truncatum]